MAQRKKCAATVIVHELLAFLQNQLNIIDDSSLEQICILHYTEDDIIAAVKVLQNSLISPVRLMSHGDKKKDLQEMFKVFKETNPNDIPIFAAHDLHLLPSIAMDNDIITRLLKDIFQLKTELTSMQRKYLKMEQNSIEMRNEVLALRNASVSSESVSPSPERQLSLRSTDSFNGQEETTASATAFVESESINTAPSCSSTIPSEASTPTKIYPPKFEVCSSSTSVHNHDTSQAKHEVTMTPSENAKSACNPVDFVLIKNRQQQRNRSQPGMPKYKPISMEQVALKNDIEVSGVIENSDENIMDVARKVISAIGVTVKKRDMVEARRVGSVRYGPETGQRPRTIVIRFADQAVQEKIMRKARSSQGISKGYDLTDTGTVYIQERLTKAGVHRN